MMRRLLTLAALVVVAVLAVLTAREIALGRSEVAAADDAAGRSDWWEAVVHARAAAEALVPGSPWPDRGRQRLEAIGRDAEARGDDATAMLAYAAMRAAALATRAPGSRSDRWRTRAEEGLARVAASRRDVGMPHTSEPAGVAPEHERESMLDALRENEPPPTWRMALLAAAATSLLGGLAGLAWAGADASARSARIAQALAAAGIVAYAIVLLVD
jgi:hypothetical protein